MWCHPRGRRRLGSLVVAGCSRRPPPGDRGHGATGSLGRSSTHRNAAAVWMPLRGELPGVGCVAVEVPGDNSGNGRDSGLVAARSWTKPWLLLVSALLTVVVVAVPGGSARACSCMTFTVDSALAGGVAAFVGTPQAEIDGALAGQQTYGPRGWQFEVEAVVKGALADEVEVWPSAGGECGPTFTVRRRVGVVLRRDGDRYVTDDCGGVWLPDELLHPGALAAPSGQAPVSLIAAGRSGPAMLAAYDVDGNLVAWGLGEPADEMSHLAMCPGSTTFVGIAGWDQPRLVRRDVASLGLLSAVVLPERGRGQLADDHRSSRPAVRLTRRRRDAPRLGERVRRRRNGQRGGVDRRRRCERPSGGSRVGSRRDSRWDVGDPAGRPRLGPMWNGSSWPTAAGSSSRGYRTAWGAGSWRSSRAAVGWRSSPRRTRPCTREEIPRRPTTGSSCSTPTAPFRASPNSASRSLPTRSSGPTRSTSESSGACRRRRSR